MATAAQQWRQEIGRFLFSEGVADDDVPSKPVSVKDENNPAEPAPDEVKATPSEPATIKDEENKDGNTPTEPTPIPNKDAKTPAEPAYTDGDSLEGFDVAFIEYFAASMIQKIFRGMKARQQVVALFQKKKEERAETPEEKPPAFRVLDYDNLQSNEGKVLLEVKGLMDMHEGRCDHCKRFREEDLPASEVFTFYRNRCCCCGKRLELTRQQEREDDYKRRNEGINRIRTRKEQTEYLRKRLLPAPMKPPKSYKPPPKTSFMSLPLVLDDNKIKKASEKWARDTPDLPGLAKVRKKKRKKSAKAQRRFFEELATPPIRPAKPGPQHSPFGFGGDSPRDIQVLVGFRKPLPRDRGPAAVYLRRRHKSRGGITQEQLDALKAEEEEGGEENEPEDEFTKQLRLHAERRQRQKQQEAEESKESPKRGPPTSPIASAKRRGRSRRKKKKPTPKKNKKDERGEFFNSRASKQPGKKTKSSYRLDHVPTRHRRQGRELQKLERIRSEKPSMLFRVLADAHCRMKMKQQP